MSLRVYPNKDYVLNVVSDENLASHIEYKVKISSIGVVKKKYSLKHSSRGERNIK